MAVCFDITALVVWPSRHGLACEQPIVADAVVLSELVSDGFDLREGVFEPLDVDVIQEIVAQLLVGGLKDANQRVVHPGGRFGALPFDYAELGGVPLGVRVSHADAPPVEGAVATLPCGWII